MITVHLSLGSKSSISIPSSQISSPSIVPVEFFTPLQPSVQFLVTDGWRLQGPIGKVWAWLLSCHLPKHHHTWVWHTRTLEMRWTTCIACMDSRLKKLNYSHWRWGAHAFNRNNFKISHLEHDIFCKQWLTIKTTSRNHVQKYLAVKVTASIPNIFRGDSKGVSLEDGWDGLLCDHPAVPPPVMLLPAMANLLQVDVHESEVVSCLITPFLGSRTP